MLLIGSVAMAVKAPAWEAMECLGLERDFEQYEENVTQMQRAANANAILNGGKEVEILEYSKTCQVQIIHMVKEHEPYLSKEDLDGLYKDMVRLIAIEELLGNGATSKLK